jgi:hypothetical protein
MVTNDLVSCAPQKAFRKRDTTSNTENLTRAKPNLVIQCGISDEMVTRRAWSPARFYFAAIKDGQETSAGC